MYPPSEARIVNSVEHRELIPRAGRGRGSRRRTDAGEARTAGGIGGGG